MGKSFSIDRCNANENCLPSALILYGCRLQISRFDKFSSYFCNRSPLKLIHHIIAILSALKKDVLWHSPLLALVKLSAKEAQ